MSSRDSRPVNEPASAGFHTTHWTMVLTARDKDGTVAQEALGRLCSTYWYPLYAFIRRRGAGPHEAEDLTQAFFSHFLEHDVLARVEPSAGKFRSFLLACLKNFLSNEREKAQAQRRGGGCQIIPLDTTHAESRFASEPVNHVTPDLLFERRWAMAVLEHTLLALRNEYPTTERRALFEDLQGFLPGGNDRLSREALAEKRGVIVGAIDVAIHRIRQRFGALLREQVLQTVSSDSEIEEEIRHLISMIGA